MKIIDFEKRGNVARFYLGDDQCNDYWGDDWDDHPYEHNAGTVYDEFVKKTVDIAVPLDWIILEPADDWSYDGNSPYSKEDFKKRRCCVLIVEPEQESKGYFTEERYSMLCAADSPLVHKIYFGDDQSVLNEYSQLEVKYW